MEQHDQQVEKVAVSVRSFYERREPFRIFHGSTNSTRPLHTGQVVDVSKLSRVLRVDTGKRIAVVEPNVPMDKLVQATLAHGLIPPVVMEFPGITVGGGFAGCAGESSSFRYGYFDQTVQSVEMVLADGQVVTASHNDSSELFNAAAGSLGTLGITTKLELSLIPSKRYVRLVYQPFSSIRDTIESTRQATADPNNDYVDAIIFSKDHGVVMTGQLTEELPTATQPRTFSGGWDPWFYMHTQAKCTTKPSTDYIPIAEYLFRYDRAGFWVGAEAFKYFNPVPNNSFTRWFLNDFMHTRMLFRALHGSNMSFGHVVQDLSLPYGTAEDFIGWCADHLAIWPLWLCPLRATEPPTFHPQTSDGEGVPQPMLNIGLWGKGADDLDNFVAQNRALEARLVELGGRKVLYSHTYYTQDEFWVQYDKKWYDSLRQKYSATTLPTVYDKVKVNMASKRKTGRTLLQQFWDAWPFAGIWGVWCAIQSKDYLIHRAQPGWKYWKMDKLETRSSPRSLPDTRR